MSKKETAAKDPLAPPGTESKAKTQETADPSTDGAKKEAKAEKTPKRSKFQLLYPDASVITLLAKENPKKEGSKCRTRFQNYFTVKTVGEFIQAGGMYADIAYDVGRRFISVEVIADAPPAPTGDAAAADSKAA